MRPFAGLLLLLPFGLIGQDTILSRIVTSYVPIRNIFSNEGKLYVQRYDGVHEFDGKDFRPANIPFPEVVTLKPDFKEWVKLINPKLEYGLVQLSNDGIYWVIVNNRFLYGFKIQHNIKQTLGNQSVRGIYRKGKDSLFAFTYKGLFLQGQQILKDTLVFSNTNLFAQGEYLYFAANHRDDLYRLHMGSLALEKFLAVDITRPIHKVSCLLFFQGAWFIGGEGGLLKVGDGRKPEQLSKHFIQHLVAINGELWVAAQEGLYQLVRGVLVKRASLSCTGVFPNGNNLLVSSFHGLWSYDRKSRQIRNVLKGTRFENLETDAVYVDHYGNYWMSSIDGIIRFDPSGKRFAQLMEGIEFNRRAFFFASDTLYFGSFGLGLIQFQEEDFIGENVMITRPEKGFQGFGYYFLISLVVASSIFYGVRRWRMAQETPIKRTLPQELEVFRELEIYIRNNALHLNVDQLLERSGLTRYAFYDRFPRYFGKKPKQYLEEAKALAIKNLNN